MMIRFLLLKTVKFMSGEKNKEKIIVSYVPYDAETLMKFIEYKNQGCTSLFELLKMLTNKCFTLMFSINGGAALAILAFLGNVITKDFQLWKGIVPWMQWALVWFSFGAGAVVLAAMLSYIAQSYFCESLDVSIENDKSALKVGNELADGRIVDDFYIKNNGEIKKLHRLGQWARNGAIIVSLFSLVLFGLGIYCCYGAFSTLQLM